MKPFSILTVFLVLLCGCERKVDTDQLQIRGGLIYEIGATTPYSGNVVHYNDEQGFGGDLSPVLEHLTGVGIPGLSGGGSQPKRVKSREFQVLDGKFHGLDRKWFQSWNATQGRYERVKAWEINWVNGEREGQQTIWHPGGAMESEFLVNGVRHGAYIYGDLEETYVNGVRHGPSTWYSDDGRMQVNYVDGEKDGLETGEHLNGRVERYFVKGRQDGPVTHFHPDGSKRSEGMFVNGRQEGLFTVYRSDGTKESEETFLCGRSEEGSKTIYQADGSEFEGTNSGKGRWGDINATYEEKWADGKVVANTRWYSSGQIWVEERFLDGQKHGVWTEWLESGQMAWQGNFSEGKKHGPYTQWSEDGSIRYVKNFVNDRQEGVEVAYRKNGEKVDGVVTTHHANGELRSREYFVDGLQHGVSTYWHDTGKKAREGLFERGRRQGTHTYWDEYERKRLERTFVNGLQNGVETEWDSLGQEFSSRRFKDGRQEGDLILAGSQEGDLILSNAEIAMFDSTYNEGHRVGFAGVNRFGASYWRRTILYFEPTSDVLYPEEFRYFLSDFSWFADNNNYESWPWNRVERYSDGKKVGMHILRHDNEQESRKGCYVEGRREGIHTEWFDNGQKAREGRYVSDLEEGIHTEWDRSGEVVMETRFVKGVKQ